MVTEPVEQAASPDQPLKIDPIDGIGERRTCVPVEKLIVQVLGQSMPAGLLSTRPVPVPVTVTESDPPHAVAEASSAVPRMPAEQNGPPPLVKTRVHPITPSGGRV